MSKKIRAPLWMWFLPRKTEMIPYAKIHYSLVWAAQFDTTHSFPPGTAIGGKRGRMFAKITCEFNFLGATAELGGDLDLPSINCAVDSQLSEFVMMPCEDSHNRNSTASPDPPHHPWHLARRRFSRARSLPFFTVNKCFNPDLYQCNRRTRGDTKCGKLLREVVGRDRDNTKREGKSASKQREKSEGEYKRKKKKNRGEGEQSSGEGDVARLPPYRGYLRLISEESCQVSADNVLMEKR